MSNDEGIFRLVIVLVLFLVIGSFDYDYEREIPERFPHQP
jgi:hypothetical protein